MGEAIQLFASLESFGPCYKCGILFAAPGGYVRARQADGKDFYCPNGHAQHYTETTAQRLEKQLAQEKQRREWAEKNAEAERQAATTARRAAAIARGKLKAQSERVKNGVCPCCRRNFQNLQRHMATKHPDFAAKEK